MRRLVMVWVTAVAMCVGLDACSFLIDFDELQSGLERRPDAATHVDAGIRDARAMDGSADPDAR